MSSKNFFSPEQQDKIIAAIREAEKNTSGEIRLHVESKCKGEVLNRAAEVFKKLKMHQTAQRNGVLFYLATGTRDFAVLGDKGINEKVPENFWDSIKDKTIDHFKAGDFTSGLSEAIAECGVQLKTWFPYTNNDKNELSDEISF
ncbi:MAG: TPM domain-containing protein [Bacteroidia bacterium]